MTYESDYEKYVTEIRDRIVTFLKTIEDFEDRVYIGLTKTTASPYCFVRLMDETATIQGKEAHLYSFDFRLFVSHKTTGEPEEDEKKRVKLIGKIDDLFRQNPTLGGKCNLAVITRKQHLYRQEKNFMYLDTLITLTVTKAW